MVNRMNKELLELTPKRKSILWRYKNDNDDSILVYGISRGRAIALSGEYAINKEEVLQNKERINALGKNADINDSGISVLLEGVSARIWEMCDGSNTLETIVNFIVEKFTVDFETAMNDCIEFLQECDEKNVIDMKWRSLI